MSTMLYYFYNLTKDQSWFIHGTRKFIIFFELPILRLIFILAGAHRAIPRNSINESEHFNVFMSDLDFTLVAEKSQFNLLLSAAHTLKKLFLNLGEIEVYTLQEWHEIQSIQSSEYWSFWNRLYLIRKLSWQRKKNKDASNPYEKTKQDRGERITLKKLGSPCPLNGSIIFSDLVKEENLKIELPKKSFFLECEVTTLPNTKSDILFTTSDEARSFVAILPDMDIIPASQVLKEIKTLLIKREYLLNLASMRLKEFEGNSRDSAKDQQWMRDLGNRLSLLK